MVAEIVAVDRCGVLEGGAADVDVAVFDKPGKGSCLMALVKWPLRADWPMHRGWL